LGDDLKAQGVFEEVKGRWWIGALGSEMNVFGLPLHLSVSWVFDFHLGLAVSNLRIKNNM
jgi:hypothetical protein